MFSLSVAQRIGAGPLSLARVVAVVLCCVFHAGTASAQAPLRESTLCLDATLHNCYSSVMSVLRSPSLDMARDKEQIRTTMAEWTSTYERYRAAYASQPHYRTDKELLRELWEGMVDKTFEMTVEDPFWDLLIEKADEIAAHSPGEAGSLLEVYKFGRELHKAVDEHVRKRFPRLTGVLMFLTSDAALAAIQITFTPSAIVSDKQETEMMNRQVLGELAKRIAQANAEANAAAPMSAVPAIEAPVDRPTLRPGPTGSSSSARPGDNRGTADPECAELTGPGRHKLVTSDPARFQRLVSRCGKSPRSP